MNVCEVIQRLGGPVKAAKVLGIKRTTVAMWRAKGAIPPRHVPRVARALRVPAEAVWPDLAPPQPQQEAA